MWTHQSCDLEFPLSVIHKEIFLSCIFRWNKNVAIELTLNATWCTSLPSLAHSVSRMRAHKHTHTHRCACFQLHFHSISCRPSLHTHIPNSISACPTPQPLATPQFPQCCNYFRELPHEPEQLQKTTVCVLLCTLMCVCGCVWAGAWIQCAWVCAHLCERDLCVCLFSSDRASPPADRVDD